MSYQADFDKWLKNQLFAIADYVPVDSLWGKTAVLPAMPHDAINGMCMLGTEDGQPKVWIVGGDVVQITPPLFEKFKSGEVVINADYTFRIFDLKFLLLGYSQKDLTLIARVQRE